MTKILNMTIEELCAFVSNHLLEENIPVVLVGGACVSIYSSNEYLTRDLDFVQRYDVKRKELSDSLKKIGFTEKNRYFEHPDTDYFLEFPTGPIAVGNQAVDDFSEIETKFGKLILLTATDICKDRLAAFYHWQDRQSLQQAINIAKDNDVKIDDIKKWSDKEGMSDKFDQFKSDLNR